MNFLKRVLFCSVRCFVQSLFYFFEKILDFSDWLSQSLFHLFQKTEYVRQGKCLHTGQCCRAVGMEFPAFLHRYPLVLRTIQRWHALRYHFSYLGIKDNMLVYECLYLRKDNRCGIYWRRPSLCRRFPRALLYDFPGLHQGCGFYFTKRFPALFEEVLARAKTKR